jgi:hypothetical protein
LLLANSRVPLRARVRGTVRQVPRLGLYARARVHFPTSGPLHASISSLTRWPQRI